MPSSSADSSARRRISAPTRGCRNNRVEGNLVSDVGGNGVMIGEGKARTLGEKTWWEVAPEEAAKGNVVANNLVQSCPDRETGPDLQSNNRYVQNMNQYSL